MKVNCSIGVLPLVYPINVEFAYISWFCLQKGNHIIHLDKMGLFISAFESQNTPMQILCSYFIHRLLTFKGISKFFQVVLFWWSHN